MKIKKLMLETFEQKIDISHNTFEGVGLILDILRYSLSG